MAVDSVHCASFYLINPTSLVKPHALEQLSADLSHLNIDIAIVTETWFNNTHIDNCLTIPDYTLYRRDRFRRKGGGVCFYVRKSIDASIVQPRNSALSCIEILWLKLNLNSTVYYVACCYHPPKAVYKSDVFVSELSKDIEQISTLPGNAIIIVAGDFNGLKTDFIENDFGLSQIVCEDTHGNKILDKFFVSRPDMYHAHVFKSLIKTKHKAVHVSALKSVFVPLSIKRKKVTVYDLRQHHIDHLRYALGSFDWSVQLSCHDVQTVYDGFLSTVRQLLSVCIPSKVVSIGHKDPPFITPLVKALLVKRRKLRRCGKNVVADLLAEKINRIITRNCSKRLDRLGDASPKELWSSIKRSGHDCSQPDVTRRLIANVDEVNDYFAHIGYDPDYTLDDVTRFVDLSHVELGSTSGINVVHNDVHVDILEVERLLSKVKSTSSGFHDFPYWLFKHCSVELAEIIAHIFNCSFKAGTVPEQWLTAIVTPIPKISCPVSLNDFRPISVTPVLSRLAEKYLVKHWLRPAIPREWIDDQFGFRPTGSTECALINFMHHATHMLETNAYVRCLLIDFSKAFDTVDHALLLEKLSKLDLPASILKWIVCFLSNRGQITKTGAVLSGRKSINRGIVQGSALGPILYTVMESDLRTKSVKNILFKYADDTTLLQPEKSDVDLVDEFNGVKAWAVKNKMLINIAKTKEIILQRPRPSRLLQLPSTLVDIERVSEVKLLGVFFNNNFSFNAHVNFILSLCSQRIFLLRQLRNQGLPPKGLYVVCQAIVVSRIMYAACAWGGFLSAHQINRINSLLRRLFKYGFIEEKKDLNKLMTCANISLFKKMCYTEHCLSVLLPPVKNELYQLRCKGHYFVLPICHYDLYKHSYVVRCLFNFSS